MGASNRSAHDHMYPSRGSAGYDEAAAEQARQANDAARPLDDGGPAFPVEEVRAGEFGIRQGHDGMSLRDYFAAQGLAVLSNNEWRPGSDGELRHLAARLYQMADAMIAARAAR